MVGSTYLKPYRLVRLGENLVRHAEKQLLCDLQLHWKLRSKETHQLNRCAVVVVITSQAEIL
jgi:hypothetical protein